MLFQAIFLYCVLAVGSTVAADHQNNQLISQNALASCSSSSSPSAAILLSSPEDEHRSAKRTTCSGGRPEQSTSKAARSMQSQSPAMQPVHVQHMQVLEPLMRSETTKDYETLRDALLVLKRELDNDKLEKILTDTLYVSFFIEQLKQKDFNKRSFFICIFEKASLTPPGIPRELLSKEIIKFKTSDNHTKIVPISIMKRYFKTIEDALEPNEHYTSEPHIAQLPMPFSLKICNEILDAIKIHLEAKAAAREGHLIYMMLAESHDLNAIYVDYVDNHATLDPSITLAEVEEMIKGLMLLDADPAIGTIVSNKIAHWLDRKDGSPMHEIYKLSPIPLEWLRRMNERIKQLEGYY